MRVVASLWPFSYGVRLGWATTTVPNPPLTSTCARAYLLRGQTMLFSRGFGQICDQLRLAGVCAEDLRCVGDRWVRKQLATTTWPAGCGGRLSWWVIRAAVATRCSLPRTGGTGRQGRPHHLRRCGGPYRVAANVRRAVHLYRSRWRLYPARPLEAAVGSAARIDNIDLDSPNSPIKEAKLHHLNITARPAVREWIVRLVLETASGSLVPPAASQ